MADLKALAEELVGCRGEVFIRRSTEGLWRKQACCR